MTSESRGPRLERLLEQVARRVSGGQLHPLEVLRSVQSAFEDAVSDGLAPNDIRVLFHPADYERYRPALARLHAEVEALLEEIEGRRGLARVGDRVLRFDHSERTGEGTVTVLARFADTEHRPLAGLPAGATRRLTRHRDVALVLGDGASVPVSHTPFTIGRGPGNDLVVASMAVSRRHAELVATDDGFALRDLGSHNGLVVDGTRLSEVELGPGVVVALGDVQLTLKYLP
jgi:hypothetical protein